MQGWFGTSENKTPGMHCNMRLSLGKEGEEEEEEGCKGREQERQKIYCIIYICKIRHRGLDIRSIEGSAYFLTTHDKGLPVMNPQSSPQIWIPFFPIVIIR